MNHSIKVSSLLFCSCRNRRRFCCCVIIYFCIYRYSLLKKTKGSSVAAKLFLQLQKGSCHCKRRYLAAANLTLLQQMPLIVQGCCVNDRFTRYGEGGVEERGKGQKQQSANKTLQASSAGLFHGSSDWHSKSAFRMLLECLEGGKEVGEWRAWGSRGGGHFQLEGGNGRGIVCLSWEVLLLQYAMVIPVVRATF